MFTLLGAIVGLGFCYWLAGMLRAAGLETPRLPGLQSSDSLQKIEYDERILITSRPPHTSL